MPTADPGAPRTRRLPEELFRKTESERGEAPLVEDATDADRETLVNEIAILGYAKEDLERKLSSAEAKLAQRDAYIDSLERATNAAESALESVGGATAQVLNAVVQSMNTLEGAINTAMTRVIVERAKIEEPAAS